MSLNTPLFYVIPEETVQVAKAAFPKGNRYLLLRDTFGSLFHNRDFQHLCSHTGQPGKDPARLALITILPFAERLADEQAADSVRSRIDWTYLLALPLAYAGFDSSVLRACRMRLVHGNAEQLLVATVLTQFREHDVRRKRGRQRSDSTCAVSHCLVSLPQAGRTRKEVLEGIVNLIVDTRCCAMIGSMTTPSTPSYKHYRFPAEIIAHAIWLYYHFSLSFAQLSRCRRVDGRPRYGCDL